MRVLSTQKRLEAALIVKYARGVQGEGAWRAFEGNCLKEMNTLCFYMYHDDLM